VINTIISGEIGIRMSIKQVQGMWMGLDGEGLMVGSRQM